ncbi:MAG: hypothetical protein QOG30_600 [Acidimicrobiaceae bacterium]
MTEPERQHVLDRDRPLGGHGVVELGIDRPQYGRCRQLGKPAFDGVVERHRAVFDEQHRRRACDRLGDRRDAEDGVASDRFGVVEGLVPDRFDVHVVARRHERDEPGHVASLDVASQRVMERVPSGVRKPGSVMGR